MGGDKNYRLIKRDAQRGLCRVVYLDEVVVCAGTPDEARFSKIIVPSRKRRPVNEHEYFQAKFS